jgi:mono/diheme cytochrome c family protein
MPPFADTLPSRQPRSRHLSARWPGARPIGAAVAAVLVTLAAPAGAQTSVQYAPGGAYFRANDRFAAASGAEVYDTVCAGCHMAQGKGAVGGGTYPALAANKNLASSTYLIYTVVNGRRGMPPFGNALDDTQIAQVTNYIRSQFGNAYTDTVSAADVKAARPAPLAAAAPR